MIKIKAYLQLRVLMGLNSIQFYPFRICTITLVTLVLLKRFIGPSKLMDFSIDPTNRVSSYGSNETYLISWPLWGILCAMITGFDSRLITLEPTIRIFTLTRQSLWYVVFLSTITCVSFALTYCKIHNHISSPCVCHKLWIKVGDHCA